MIRFASKLIIFLFPMLLALGIVEHRLAAIPTSYKLKQTSLERGIDKAQVIISGSSHAYYGIKPHMLGVPALNIAFGNQDFYYDTSILLKFLPQAKSLKLVIIPVSYFSFEYTLEGSLEEWRTSYYYRFLNIPHNSRGFRIADHSFIALYGLQQTRSFLWNGIPTTNPEAPDENGGNRGLGPAKAKSAVDLSATIRVHNSLMKRQHIDQNRLYLEQLLDTLKARGIQFVLITTPCSQGYYENLNPEAYTRMQEEIQRLRRNYGFEYRNYLTDSRFNDEDFWDSDHLSTVGAEKFSQILKDEVVTKYLH